MIELGGSNRADKVGREISKCHCTPVDVLQDSHVVRFHIDIEKRLHVVVPPLRKTGYLLRSTDDILFYVVSQNDVEWVSQLVSLHSNEGALYAIDRTVDFFRRIFFKRFIEARKKFVCKLPEGFGEANVAFPEQGLRLVGSHRERLVDADGGRNQVLFVDGVSALVDGPRQSLVPFILPKPRSDSNILCAHRRRKRVNRNVDSPLFLVVSDCRDEFFRQLLLFFNVEGPLERFRRRLGGR
mmetsp:Transcript_28982/g.62155  ORF Transcript_28982/g.62155 Transcript_28982/m.62155 type:complete len:240 (-) Transcript_28982:394-1113(-)